MAIQKLSQAGAFGPGSDLWILPPLRHSAWARKVDWYLNFQISRAKDHQFRKLDPELEEIMNTNELLPLIPVETSPVPPPLLIASHSHLPNQMTLEIPMDKELKNWVLLCHHIWKNLGRPSLRVFLPGPALFENFVEEWPDSQTATDISLVSEIAPGHS